MTRAAVCAPPEGAPQGDPQARLAVEYARRKPAAGVEGPVAERRRRGRARRGRDRARFLPPGFLGEGGTQRYLARFKLRRSAAARATRATTPGSARARALTASRSRPIAAFSRSRAKAPSRPVAVQGGATSSPGRRSRSRIQRGRRACSCALMEASPSRPARRARANGRARRARLARSAVSPRASRQKFARSRHASTGERARAAPPCVARPPEIACARRGRRPRRSVELARACVRRAPASRPRQPGARERERERERGRETRRARTGANASRRSREDAAQCTARSCGDRAAAALRGRHPRRSRRRRGRERGMKQAVNAPPSRAGSAPQTRDVRDASWMQKRLGRCPPTAIARWTSLGTRASRDRRKRVAARAERRGRRVVAGEQRGRAAASSARSGVCAALERRRPRFRSGAQRGGGGRRRLRSRRQTSRPRRTSVLAARATDEGGAASARG